MLCAVVLRHVFSRVNIINILLCKTFKPSSSSVRVGQAVYVTSWRRKLLQAQIKLEKPISIFKFLLSSRSTELGEAHTNAIKHDI